MTLYKSLDSAIKNRSDVVQLKVTLKGGAFDSELLHFPQLEELYLDGDCTTLPGDLTGWNRLKTLSIKWSSFSGDLSPLFSLTRLENLKIIETPMKRFFLPLGRINAPLKNLTIKSCGLEELPEEISMLTQLFELSLPSNQLTTLPFSFFELKMLKRLSLDSNNFVAFPDVIKKMSTLSHLSFDSNPFPDEEKERIQREYNIWVS